VDQNTMDYRKLITFSHSESKRRATWLTNGNNPTRTSILKSTRIFIPDQRTTYTVEKFYAAGIPPVIHIMHQNGIPPAIHIMQQKALPPPPPKILYKSKKNLDRMLMIVPTLPYSVQEVISFCQIRAKTEDLNLSNKAYSLLGAIGQKSGLRYAIQLLLPANTIAETCGRSQILRDDVSKADDLNYLLLGGTKKKKPRAFGDVIPTKISYPSKETNWRFLPTRAFANIMNFLEIPQSKLCYSLVCHQWTIKSKKMCVPNYPHSNMLNILNTLNVHFVDRNLSDFPMKELMEGSSSYLNNKEVRFSEKCYGRKGASIEELNEMYKNEEVDPWYGMGDCSWKYVYMKKPHR
jgi:hypothetical protein